MVVMKIFLSLPIPDELWAEMRRREVDRRKVLCAPIIEEVEEVEEEEEEEEEGEDANTQLLSSTD